MFSFLLDLSLHTFRVAMASSPDPHPDAVNILKRRCEDLEDRLAHTNTPQAKSCVIIFIFKQNH
jgi:hypothetical protein